MTTAYTGSAIPSALDDVRDPRLLERELRGAVYIARAHVHRLIGAWPIAAQREPWQARSIERAIANRMDAEQRAQDEGINLDTIPTFGAYARPEQAAIPDSPADERSPAGDPVTAAALNEGREAGDRIASGNRPAGPGGPDRPTLYVVALNRFGPDDIAGALVAPEYGALASHVSSNMAWLEHDLTQFPEPKAKLAELYPDGYTIRTVDLLNGAEIPADITQWLTPAETPSTTSEEVSQ